MDIWTKYFEAQDLISIVFYCDQKLAYQLSVLVLNFNHKNGHMYFKAHECIFESFLRNYYFTITFSRTN